MQKRQELKMLFHTGNPAEGDILLCELGNDHLCLATADLKGRIQSIRYFDSCSFQVLEGMLMERSYQKVVLSIAYPEALVVPKHLFDENGSNQWLEITYPGNKEFKHISAPEWQMMISYSLPSQLKDMKDVDINHVYTCDLKSSFHSENQINLNFSPKFFRVLVKKGSRLQLCQMYPYQTPLDVVYYLLNICLKFNLKQEATHLSLSGLIDKDSHLYKEIHQYFSDISFEEASLLPEASFPAHYFTSIYQLAACAL